MMRVIRLRRGWQIRLTDNEFQLLREMVGEGKRHFGNPLSYKQRKVFETDRWQSDDPLSIDEDRRAIAN